uniref:A-kinase anchor 110kDa C-terminal domain-containing protein n=1 Tax=Sphenodon punctatus TaxID=8508 RepID=A0A8D0H7P3_SPHPU
MFFFPIAKMSREVDWLHSQAGLCKVDLYSPDGQKDQDRKVICFVDVSKLNVKDKDQMAKRAASQSSNISDPSNELDLGNLEEKEVIVIKDNEKNNQSNTEGAVCLFKQGSTEELNLVSWLNNDLQKYAVGFQHALTPSDSPRKRNSFSDPSAADRMSQNSDTSFRGAGGQRRNPDDLSYYVNKLCSLVVQTAHKEIKNKVEGGGKCVRQAINPRSSLSATGSHDIVDAYDSRGKLPSPRASQERASRRDDPGKNTSLFYGEMLNQNGMKQSSDRQMCQQGRQSGQDDGSSVSKGLMVCANQVASDMMFSFMKTMKVHKGSKNPPPACMVLKKVFLKHTKDIISDLIDSTMKNLHNVTGVLMTDADFVTTVKKNLFSAGTQKSTEILEAMVKRLFKILAGEQGQSRSQSLAFTTLKSGSQSDPRSQGMQFTAVKSEMHGGPRKDKGHGPTKPQLPGNKGSDKGTTDVYAKDLIVTALTLIQQHLLEKNKEPAPPHDSATSSFGYVHRNSHCDRAGGSQSSKSLAKQGEGRRDSQQLDSQQQKGDLSNILLSIIQKVLRGFGGDDTSGEAQRGYKEAPPTDSRPQRSLSKQPSGGMDPYENMEQINKTFIDQLVESVMKLCLVMAKGNNGFDSAIGDMSDEQNMYGGPSKNAAGPRRGSQGKSNGKQLGPAGSEVIVNNQHADNGSLSNELQAILQWMVASHFNLPNLTFMNENEGDLSKLPQVADKAAKKGYSVGDLLQEVMRYLDKNQMDSPSGLFDYLLARL